MVHRQGGDVLLAYPLLAQLHYEGAGIRAGHLENGEAADVGEKGGLHGAGQVLQLGQALSSQDEGCPELPQLGEHGLVVHAGHGLHLVHHHKGATAWEMGSLSCSRITESTRFRREAPTRADTSRPTVPWAVETSTTPPSKITSRRSMVERDWPRMARALLEEA